MTPAPDRGPITRAFALRYARWRLGRSMDGVYARGLDRVRALSAGRPLILAANHVAWWDAFLALIADDAVGCEGYALMDAANLAALPFFSRLGAIPLDRSAPMRSLSGLRAASALLQAPGRAVWIFPQGRQRPAHLRPLGLKGGVRLLAKHSGALVVPVALQYAFRETHLPAAALDFGAPLAPGRDLEARLEAGLIQGLDAIDGWLERGDPDFLPLLNTRQARIDQGIGARLLGARAG